MKTYKQITEQWLEALNGGQVLVSKDHPLRLYVDITSNGQKELLVEVSGDLETVRSTASIQVYNYKEGSGTDFLGFELLDKTLDVEYTYMCLDIVNASQVCKTKTEAYKMVITTYRKWNNLLANVRREILSEQAIRGLMGELKYIQEELESGRLALDIVRAWKIHKDASRDFVFDTTWAEIKTAEITKEYVTISSLEQLEFSGGELIVFRLNKTHDDVEGLSLNELIGQIKEVLDPVSTNEFTSKLIEKGYHYSDEYNHYRYAFKEKLVYFVDEQFPRITPSMVDDAIVSAKYDIRLDRIEKWRAT